MDRNRYRGNVLPGPQAVSIFKDGAYYPLGSGEEMSEAEYEWQYQLCNDLPDDQPPPALEMSPGYWRTRDHRTLRIREMTTKHLKNAITLFRRLGFDDFAKVRELKTELKSRK